jgi:hypothetical protein
MTTMRRGAVIAVALLLGGAAHASAATVQGTISFDGAGSRPTSVDLFVNIIPQGGTGFSSRLVRVALPATGNAQYSIPNVPKSTITILGSGIDAPADSPFVSQITTSAFVNNDDETVTAPEMIFQRGYIIKGPVQVAGGNTPFALPSYISALNRTSSATITPAGIYSSKVEALTDPSSYHVVVYQGTSGVASISVTLGVAYAGAPALPPNPPVLGGLVLPRTELVSGVSTAGVTIPNGTQPGATIPGPPVFVDTNPTGVTDASGPNPGFASFTVSEPERLSTLHSRAFELVDGTWRDASKRLLWVMRDDGKPIRADVVPSDHAERSVRFCPRNLAGLGSAFDACPTVGVGVPRTVEVPGPVRTVRVTVPGPINALRVRVVSVQVLRKQIIVTLRATTPKGKPVKGVRMSRGKASAKTNRRGFAVLRVPRR